MIVAVMEAKYQISISESLIEQIKEIIDAEEDGETVSIVGHRVCL